MLSVPGIFNCVASKRGEGGRNLDEVPAGPADWSGKEELFYSLGHTQCLVVCW